GVLAVAVVLLLPAFAAIPHFLPTPPAFHPSSGPAPAFALPDRLLLGLAALAFLTNTVEGSVADWSALYLSVVRGLTPAQAATGFAMFSFAMAVCRLAGGPVVARLGEKSIVACGGLLIALGAAFVTLVPVAWLSPLGFGIIALGAANALPVMIGAASRTP